MKILNNFAIFLITSFFAISIAQSKDKTEWYKTFENESATFFIDTHMLIYENGYHMFWLIENFKKPFLKRYKSILRYTFFDCKRKTYKFFNSFAYASQMASGKDFIKLPHNNSWSDSSNKESIFKTLDLICNDSYIKTKTRGLNP